MHFSSSLRQPLRAALALIVHPQSHKLLLHLRDGKTRINPHKWAFFGGLCEAGETPEVGLCRELREELGLSLHPDDYSILRSYRNDRFHTDRFTFLVFVGKEKSEMILGEGADFDWFTRDEALALDLTDQTRDDLYFYYDHYAPTAKPQ